MKKKSGYLKISKALKEEFLHPKPLPPEIKERPKCRFCGGPIRALNNNGMIGPGYREWNYTCEHCGKVQ